jgi:hypothetical protein
MKQSNIDSEIKVDVLEYLGKHDGGVISMLSLCYNDVYYEATFYYTKDLLILTPDEKLEKELGCTIEEWSGYDKLMLHILSRVVPYNEVINIVDEFDPEKWGLFLSKK